MKILALCDSPTCPTGFGRVARELLSRFAAFGAVVDVWAINYNGHGYRKAEWATLYPAAGGIAQWHSLDNLALFLKQLQAPANGYTHVWIMQDAFALAQHDFPKALKQVCKEGRIRSTYYFPADADWDPEWSEIITSVKVPIAYTDYGRQVAVRALQANHAYAPFLNVLPHGVEPHFSPLPGREKIRAKFWEKDWVLPSDFLLLNVNQHQRRKDIPRSLQILAELIRRRVPAKMLFHMHETSPYDATSLKSVGRQLGLTLGVEFQTHDALFRNGFGLLKDNTLCELYNIADAYLTTTRGEGWGLGLTEALACGCPVFAPEHTSCKEISDELAEAHGVAGRMINLPCHDYDVLPMDCSRIRPVVDVKTSADLIEAFYHGGTWRDRPPLPASARAWLNWDRVAREMFKLMGGITLPESQPAIPTVGEQPLAEKVED